MNASWDLVIGWLKGLVGLVREEVFWTAISACGTVVALYLIYRQIAVSSKLSAYEFLRREDERFHSATLREARAKLACELLRSQSTFAAVDVLASPVLSYFDDLGLMLRRGIAPIHYIWTMQCWYILRYWGALRQYIDQVRAKDHDKTLYFDFEFLAARIQRYDRKKAGAAAAPSRHDIRLLLEEEAGIVLRPATFRDIPALVDIERESFNEFDAYSAQEFQDLLTRHREGVTVAEVSNRVAGYIIAYRSSGTAEIDSMAVSSAYRRLGVATRLMTQVIDRFRRDGARRITLEVRPANHEGIALYRNHGFQEIPNLLENYYADGGSAYRMVRDLAVGSADESSRSDR